MSPAPARTFSWEETRGVLAALDAEARHRLALDDKRQAFVAPGIHVRPPLVFPIGDRVATVTDYLDALPEAPGRHIVVILQAGAAALGVFEGGTDLHTKGIKKYVVRGRGRSQPSHLQTKGKSRYGSRLRLQNARKLLDEVNARLNDWVARVGPPDLLFYSCPVRLWTELFRARVPPPFEFRDPAVKIPLDLPVPTTGVLLRAYRSLCHGQVM